MHKCIEEGARQSGKRLRPAPSAGGGGCRRTEVLGGLQLADKPKAIAVVLLSQLDAGEARPVAKIESGSANLIIGVVGLLHLWNRALAMIAFPQAWCSWL